LSTIKQEVFQETGTYEVNAPADWPINYNTMDATVYPQTTVPTNSAYSPNLQNNYFLTDYQKRTVVPLVEDKTDWSVEAANQGSFGGPTPHHPFTRIPGQAPYTTAFDTSSKLTLNIGYWSQDLRKAGPNGLGADRCVVRITGAYSLGILVSPFQRDSSNITTSSSQFRYWYNNATGTQVQGTPVNMDITNISTVPHANPGDPSNQYVKTAPTPFEMTSDRWTNTIEPVASGDIAVNTIQAGSATSHGDIKQTDNLEFIIEIENTTPISNGVPGFKNEYFVIPYTNGIPNVYYETRDGQNYTNHIYYRGTYTLGWEGNLHTIDDLDGDSVVFTTPTTTMVASAFTRVDMDPEELTDNFTVTEATAVRKFGSAGLSSQATVSASAKSTKFITETITAITNLDATTENFVRMDPETITATSSVSVTPTFKPTALSDMSHTATVSTFARMIYDITTDYSWNTFNLNTYFVTGFVEDEFVSEQGEYNWNFIQSESWDSWPTITWIGNESSWDNWPDDVWEKTYKVNTIGSMLITPLLKIGDIVEYNGVFTVTENVALNEPGEADLVANITIDATASGVISISAEEFNVAFTPILTANITYGLQDDEVTITGAFTPVLTASAITDTFADIDVAATLSITPSFKPAGFSTITTATELDLAPTFKPAGFSDMVASAGTLTLARLFFPTDPYNIIKVAQENRVVLVPTENRQTLVMEENRVNIVGQETRAYQVPQETRRIKLRIPPYSNRFSTPRVRSSQ
jgi:hypothetical protein